MFGRIAERATVCWALSRVAVYTAYRFQQTAILPFPRPRQVLLDERAHGWVPKGATVFGPTWPHTPQASSRAVSSRAIQLPNVKRLAVVGLHPCTSLPNGDRSRFSQTAAALAKISFRGPAATGRVRPDRDVRGILRAIFWEFLEKTSRMTSGTGLSPSEATSCRRTGTTSSPVGRPQPGGPPPGPGG